MACSGPTHLESKECSGPTIKEEKKSDGVLPEGWKQEDGAEVLLHPEGRDSGTSKKPKESRENLIFQRYYKYLKKGEVLGSSRRQQKI